MLYSHVLGKDELGLLRDIIALLRLTEDEELSGATHSNSDQGAEAKGGSRFAKRFRQQLKRYATERGALHDATPQAIWSVFSKENWPMRHSAFVALLTDFLLFRFDAEVLHQVLISNNRRIEILNSLEKLRSAVTNLVDNLNNPFNYLASELRAEDLEMSLPDYFTGEFIGYRRSSSSGTVIRFLFDIRHKGPERSVFVRYNNRYVRGSTEYVVNGGGMFAGDTLYLFGHARTKSGKSHGFRMQALRETWPGSGMLTGPIVSRDKEAPFGARILLIPRKLHHFTKAQMTEGSNIENNIMKEPELIEIESYIDEIKENTRHLFPKFGDRGVFFYVSNITSTVVKGIPDQNDSIILSEIMIREQLHRDFLQELESSDEPEYNKYRAALLQQLKPLAERNRPSG